MEERQRNQKVNNYQFSVDDEHNMPKYVKNDFYQYGT